MQQPLFSLQAALQLEALQSVRQLAALMLTYDLQTSVWCLYLTFLVLQIHGCELINIIHYVTYLHYLSMGYQPSPLTLQPPATSVYLLLLGVCANITQLCLLITSWQLLVRSLLVVLWLTWCFQIILGNISSLPAIRTHQSSLLTNTL